MNKFVRFAITGLAIGWIAWKTNWPEFLRAFATLDVSMWLAAVGLLVFAQLVSAARWQIFARQLDMDRGYWQLTRYYFIGMYFSLFLPTSVGGDVVRVWYLNANSGRKLRAAGAVFIDRLNGLIVLVALACVAVWFAPPEMPSWVPFVVYGIAAAGVCGVLGLAAFSRWGRLPENRKQQIAVMWEVVRHPRDLIVTSALSLVVQISSAAIVWLVGMGLKIEIPFSYYAVFVPMVSLITLLPSIGGMGVREMGFDSFLLPMGVSTGLATAFSLMYFFVQVAVGLVGGLVYLLSHEKGVRTLSLDSEKKGPDTFLEVSHGPVDRDSDQGRTRQLDRAA